MVQDAEAKGQRVWPSSARIPSGSCSRTTRASPASGASCGTASLDELPQLWNVLRGDMSLVGPRPMPPSVDEQISGWGRRRLDLTPGITGLWQVLGRTHIPFEEMVKLDYLYVTNWSLWQDIRLLDPHAAGRRSAGAASTRQLGGPVRRKRVVVTGGAGFIGSHVVDELVAPRRRRRGRSTTSASASGREPARAGERRGASSSSATCATGALLERELARRRVVLHMACDNLRASLANPERSHDVNATGYACAPRSPPLARASSGSSTSRRRRPTARRFAIPMDEEHPLRPTTVYGAAKAAGELYAQPCMRAYGLPVTVIRPFNSYGPALAR